MSDQNAQEPTMEEILASIRRIISEDDAPAETPAVADSDDEPESEPEPAPRPPTVVAEAEEEEGDVLELTDPIAAPTVETHGDLDIYSSDAEPVAAAPVPRSEDIAPKAPVSTPPPSAAPRPDNKLVSDSAAQASASAFSSLAQAVAMPPAGLTLEDVTRELLKPLLAQWLDENLPRIVEAKVEEEVQRIARGR